MNWKLKSSRASSIINKLACKQVSRDLYSIKIFELENRYFRNFPKLFDAIFMLIVYSAESVEY